MLGNGWWMAGTPCHPTDYARLGPDADAPYLLAVPEGVDGEGHFVLE